MRRAVKIWFKHTVGKKKRAQGLVKRSAVEGNRVA